MAERTYPESLLLIAEVSALYRVAALTQYAIESRLHNFACHNPLGCNCPEWHHPAERLAAEQSPAEGE